MIGRDTNLMEVDKLCGDKKKAFEYNDINHIPNESFLSFLVQFFFTL